MIHESVRTYRHIITVYYYKFGNNDHNLISAMIINSARLKMHFWDELNIFLICFFTLN